VRGEVEDEVWDSGSVADLPLPPPLVLDRQGLERVESRLIVRDEVAQFQT
jgi:hypothetical protein